MNSPHLMQAELLVPETHDALVGFAATWIAMRVRNAIELRGRATLFLSGGPTPVPIHERLAAISHEEPIDWPKVTLGFVDERCVAPEHPESNYGSAERALLDRLPAAPGDILRMRGEDPDPEAAARDYEASLPDEIDVMVLGMGADGHVASLFPHAEALTSERRVVATTSPVAPERRISLTLPAIRSARLRLMVIEGADRAPAVARALEEDVDVNETPAQGIGPCVWLLDQPAAAGLSERHRPTSR